MARKATYGVLLDQQENPSFKLESLEGMVVNAGESSGTPYLRWCTPTEYWTMKTWENTPDQYRVGFWKEITGVRLDVVEVEEVGATWQGTEESSRIGRLRLFMPSQPRVFPDSWRDYYELSGKVVKLATIDTTNTYAGIIITQGIYRSRDAWCGSSWAKYLSYRADELWPERTVKVGGPQSWRKRGRRMIKNKELKERRQVSIGRRNRAKLPPPRTEDCRCGWYAHQNQPAVFHCPVHSRTVQHENYTQRFEDCLWDPATQTLIRASDYLAQGWTMVRPYFDRTHRVRLYLESEQRVVCVAFENLSRVPEGVSCYERYVPAGYERAEWQLVVGEPGAEPVDVLDRREVELGFEERLESDTWSAGDGVLQVGSSLASSTMTLHSGYAGRLHRFYEQRITPDNLDLEWHYLHQESEVVERIVPVTRVWWMPVGDLRFQPEGVPRDLAPSHRLLRRPEHGYPRSFQPDISGTVGIIYGEAIDPTTGRAHRATVQQYYRNNQNHWENGYVGVLFWEEVPGWLREAFLEEYPVCSCGRERYHAHQHTRCRLCRDYRNCLRCGELTYFGEADLAKGKEHYCHNCERWVKDVRHVIANVTEADVQSLVSEMKQLLQAPEILEGTAETIGNILLSKVPAEDQWHYRQRIRVDDGYTIYVLGKEAYQCLWSPQELRNRLHRFLSVSIPTEEFVTLLGELLLREYRDRRRRSRREEYTAAPGISHWWGDSMQNRSQESHLQLWLRNQRATGRYVSSLVMQL